MNSTRSSLPIELTLTGGLLLAALAIPALGLRLLETVAGTIAVLVLSANTIRYRQTGAFSRLEGGLAILVVPLLALTLPEQPVPSAVVLAAYLTIAVVPLVLTAVRARAHSADDDPVPGLRLLPALELALVLPFLFSLLWLPFFHPASLPAGYGYLPGVSLVIAALTGLVALPALAVSLGWRTVAHRRLAVVQLASVLLLVGVLGYIVSLVGSPPGLNYEQRIVIYRQAPPLAAALLACYVIARVRSLSHT